MQVKIKKTHKNAVIPSYAKDGDAGLDLTAVDFHTDEQGNYVYDTGIALEIPKGYVGLVFPRSSIADKELLLTNSVGVIDSGYRGSIKAKFKPTNNTKTNINIYKVGDRIAQLIILPYPHINFEEVEKLSETERGDKGYGSTNK